ncbi:unnamed protein product [Withania somnifera]
MSSWSPAFCISSIMLMITFTSLLLICETVEAQAITRLLPQQEKNALKEIAEQLGKKDWDFNLNPCDGNTNWTTPIIDDKSLHVNDVTCSCSTNNGLCHIQTILLKGQDLPGVLPPSLVKLPYLKKIDLSRNHLSGTIPPEWAATKLEYMSVMLNQLSGPIPKYLGNMTTLTNLYASSIGFQNTHKDKSLEYNLFNGIVPKELGNMVNLQSLRLNGNNFTGKFPSFESLKNLKELKISDLTGSASEFPLLENMTGLSRLVLRNCNISGNIPSYLANMSELKILDLSFNRLEGRIPDLEDLKKLEFLYLTSNKLTGTIHNRIKSRNSVTDLSYNNFDESSVPTTCPETLNLFRSYNSTKKSELAKCFSSNPCSKRNTNYEADESSVGAAKFSYSKESWGASNTEHFSESTVGMNSYKVTNVSAFKRDDSELYTTARLSGLSLTYYGRCLANGKYTVRLYLAEIVIRDNRSFQSLGKRIFDVYIQGERKLKDFDIRTDAGGVDKPLIKKFNAVVEDGILEVRFQYVGKGTPDVSRRGNYGPLVSAISFEANSKICANHKKMVLIVAGAVVSSLILIFTILFVSWRRSRKQITKEEELGGLDLLTGVFTIRKIKATTDNFDASNKIGEGGFGSVYKGTLWDGTVIAVKVLSSKSKQGNREFVNEIGIISGLQHLNLVKLYGCCAEGNQLLLVYEYLENNSLARALFGPVEHQLKIDWPTRQEVCIGIAKGLAFLHKESSLKVVHRDIKPTNVLLDKKLNPKISDFGLAKLDDEDNTHISTIVAGTIGYMAPEYALWGQLTNKADVYSFGVVALEIFAGKSNMAYFPNEKFVCLLYWALDLKRQGKLMELVDETLGSDLNKDEALRMINVALLYHIDLPEFNNLESGFCDDDVFKFQGIRDKYNEMLRLSQSQTLTHSSNITGRNCSSSTSTSTLIQSDQCCERRSNRFF